MAIFRRAVDRKGQFVDFRLTAKRDAKAFWMQALEGVRLYRLISICTDKAPGYRKGHCCTKRLIAGLPLSRTKVGRRAA